MFAVQSMAILCSLFNMDSFAAARLLRDQIDCMICKSENLRVALHGYEATTICRRFKGLRDNDGHWHFIQQQGFLAFRACGANAKCITISSLCRDRCRPPVLLVLCIC